MNRTTLLPLLLAALASCTSGHQTFESPNGKISLATDWNSPDSTIVVSFRNSAGEAGKVMALSDFGIIDHGDTIRCTGKPRIEALPTASESYTMITGKKQQCSNRYNEYIFRFGDNNEGPGLKFRLYDDGVAFRYFMDCDSAAVDGETTTISIADGTDRWMQSFDLSYERFFDKSSAIDTAITHWGYPALFNFGQNSWGLLSEGDIAPYNSASSLVPSRKKQAYSLTPARNDHKHAGLWQSPWRLMILGSLADVVESTLVTDVSSPSTTTDTDWIEPGLASWVYWAYNRGSKDFRIVKKYIDMGAELQLPYVLIDWEWDVMENGGNIDDAIRYAHDRGVKVLVWYNSSTAWTTNGAGGPLFRLNKPEDREKEFAWLAEKGVSGVKIDFFDGDTQETMQYCTELLESALRHKLLVNFHGATMPRGWQRTYPNLVSTEAVYGAEWYNNAPVLTNRAAAHNATLPFTRNVVGSMDYTPTAFSDSQHPHITSNAHELALAVLFESGIQHLADRPESLLAQPREVLEFLSSLPAAWDDTRLLGGYPADYVVLARTKDNATYIAGINGTDIEREIPLDLSRITVPENAVITFYGDNMSEDKATHPWNIGSVDTLPSSVKLAPRGGFIFRISAPEAANS